VSTQLETPRFLSPISESSFAGEDLAEKGGLRPLRALGIFGRNSNWTKDADKAEDKLPDWPDIETTASDLLGKSKDLRVLAHAAAAALRTDGWVSFLEIVATPAQWLKQNWDEVYPRIDDDAVAREQALNLLADRWAILAGVRRAPFARIDDRGYCLRDLDVAAGAESPELGARPVTKGEIEVAVRSMRSADLALLVSRLDTATRAIQEVTLLMEQKAQAAPALDPLSRLLDQLRKFLAPLAVSADAAANDAGAPTKSNGAVPAVPGSVQSRDDAVRMLEALADYFRRTEPSSPVPLLLDRARRMINQSFLDILSDLVPGSVDDAKKAAGVRDQS
jgi:type VI secretion system protein ImpA